MITWHTTIRGNIPASAVGDYIIVHGNYDSEPSQPMQVTMSITAPKGKMLLFKPSYNMHTEAMQCLAIKLFMEQHNAY